MIFCRYPIRFFTLLLSTCFAVTMVNAQAPQAGIRGVISKIDTFNSHMPGEKLYLQMDKPYYAVGDTVWFKAYLLNSRLNYSPLSSRLYVELVNDSNKIVKRIAIPVSLGLTWGNIELNPGDVREGAYTIRAYTNWMRNFGQESFFYQNFYVADPGSQAWTVNANSSLTGTGDAASVKMDVKFTSLDNKNMGLHDLQLKVLDGKHIIYRGASQTTAEGMLNVSFPLPEKTGVKNLTLVAQDKTNTWQSVSIPVNASRAKDVDIQFMPEGGSMVAGIPSHIGFKAIGEDGKGIDISGAIINSVTKEQVVTLQSAHKGMGTIELLPKAGETYTAQIKLADGQTKEVALPIVKSSGSVLHIRNTAAQDTMEVVVTLSDDMVKQNAPLYLVAQSRGVVCFAATVPAGRQRVSLHVDKGLFPTGVAHFSLLNGNEQPLNERLTFINHNDNLKIAIQPAQKSFSPRDSIKMKITATDDSGKPVLGSFSVAVTDDGQVREDNINSGSILTHLLLSDDLKGFIEDPGYYFTKDKDAWTSLDALLLTQGWIGYDWKNIISPAKPLYEPEYTHEVKGNVTNIFNKPLAGANIVMISTGKYRFVRDTVANAQGVFTFDKLPPVDSTSFVFEAHNGKTHKVVNAGIKIDEVNPADTKDLNLPAVTPWYVNSSSTVLNYIKSNTDYNKELDVAQNGINGRALKQVDIRNQAIINGSKNLNGAGNADQVIDEEAVVKAGKQSLFDLLLKQVKGYSINYLPKSKNEDFFIKDKKVRFIFDGVDVGRFYEPVTGQPDEYYFFIKQYLDYFTAEDIKGIEVLYNQRYNSLYNGQSVTDINDLLAIDPTGPRGADNAYLVITTRSGNGPNIDKATAIYVYKPMPTTLAKSFYKPRYSVKNNVKNFTDLRSTIDWEPNVITDKNGEASFTFFAADKPTTYTIVLEGSDLNGTVGYQTQQVTIAPVVQ